MEKIKVFFVSKKFFSNSGEAISLFEKSDFGEKKGEKVFYMIEEVFYLVEEKKMKVFSGNFKEIESDDLLKKIVRIDKKFLTKYFVYKDLRKKGYILKSGLKFGGDFRVYDKGKRVGKSHSQWICFCENDNKFFKWNDFSAKNRVSHSTKKNLLIAIVDSENDVSYYETCWKRII